MRNKKSRRDADRFRCVLAFKLHSLCRYYLSRFAKNLFGALYLLELPDIVGILQQIRKRILISFATQVATNFASEIFA